MGAAANGQVMKNVLEETNALLRPALKIRSKAILPAGFPDAGMWPGHALQYFLLR
jgi:hypothetical protein